MKSTYSHISVIMEIDLQCSQNQLTRLQQQQKIEKYFICSSAYGKKQLKDLFIHLYFFRQVMLAIPSHNISRRCIEINFSFEKIC